MASLAAVNSSADLLTTIGVALVFLFFVLFIVTVILPRVMNLPMEREMSRLEFRIERSKRLAELEAIERERERPGMSPEAPAALDLADIHERLAWIDLDGGDSGIALPRYFPVSIYVDSGDIREFAELREALERFLHDAGFEIVSEHGIQRGSLFQRFTGKLREPATKSELRRQLELAQLALQQQTLGRAQSEINSQGAQAALHLAQTLAMSDDCVIAFGAMVGVTKRDATGRRQTVIVELTPHELMTVQRDGRMIASAAETFEMLARLRPEEVKAQTTDIRELPPAPPVPRELPPGDDAPSDVETGT